MKQQVIFLNGAVPKENWDSYYDFLRSREYNPYEEEFKNWNKTLGDKLGDEFEYLRAPFGDIKFADYEAWKIMFEKMLPFIKEGAIIVTTSLGSTFFMKYIGENQFPIRLKKVFFVCPAIEDTPEEKLGSFSFDIEHVYNKVQRWTDQIYIYHSTDDDLVPYEQSLRLNQYFPESIFREFHDRGHFFLEAELPEIIEDIKQ